MSNRIVIILEMFGGVYTFLLTFILCRLFYIGNILSDIRLSIKQKGEKE